MTAPVTFKIDSMKTNVKKIIYKVINEHFNNIHSASFDTSSAKQNSKHKKKFDSTADEI